MILTPKVTRILFVLIGFIITAMNGCGKFGSHQINSNSSADSVGGVQLFSKVQEILQKDCMSCHRTGGTAASFEHSSPEAFIASGLIVPGKPAESKLIFRLKNYVDSSIANNNMPPTGNLSSTDYQTLYTWITEMSPEASPFQCVEGQKTLANIAPVSAKRLSNRQYRNTLIDWLALGVGNSQAVSIVNTAMNNITLPNDTGALFKRENNLFEAAHTQSYFDIADRIGLAISQSHAQTFVNQFIALNPGACTSINFASLSANCRNQLVRNVVSRGLRRPLRETNQNLMSSTGVVNEMDYANEFNSVSTQEGVSRLIFRVLMSPHFLLQVEDQNLLGSQIDNTSSYWLSNFAIINRLSYRFWNTMPDETLWAMATSRDLSNDEDYLLALNHVTGQTNKLSDSIREYFYDWLKLERTPNFSVNPRFALLAPNIQFNATLRTAMIDEVEELASFVTTSGGSFYDLFTTDISFARNSNLMSIYGQNTAAPAVITPANAVRFPANQRGGILTRAAMLISGSELTNPIMRGFHIRRDILCLTLGTAPANALDEFNNTPVPNNISTREKVHLKTAGQSCVGCHSLINPLGFGLSNYDAFGKFMEQEPIVNANNNTISGYVDVDSDVDLSPLFGPGSETSNHSEYSRFIADQQTAQVCFAEKFMSYAYIRPVSRTQDACRLERMYNSLGESGKLIDMIRSSALDQEFRVRRVD